MDNEGANLTHNSTNFTARDMEELRLLVQAVIDLLDSAIEFFPGLLRIWGYACDLGIAYEYPFDSAILVAVSSSDSLAIDQQFRTLCSPAFLQANDLEAIKLESFHRESVMAACRELLKAEPFLAIVQDLMATEAVSEVCDS